ncbi:Stp1/IreP family PP2C-type Ser/Thr phosphatase [Limnochorda pilosa]|uniref:Protein serine/threonine phosphatase n=1 Tax=Limnochorda pilosa TaxID=1555112 RepID=A0A0K2SK98_LIMPI|nr:Stp1/IreP family PP2C-type Ser/Thr phosphatase [Limnochorda pilosa]BAS27442.1 protein serine/threonine phosphatase [Limnochorda pilosa]
MRVGAVTDRGQLRPNNEDGYRVRGSLAAVADGMGGHQAGEVASSVALDVLFAHPLDGVAPGEALRAGVREANRRVHALSLARPEYAGMGTTLTAARLVGGRWWIAHVGDSRAYLFRRGDLRQVTRDHSVVAELLALGQITAEEARAHPQRNLLTRALGLEADVEVDLYSLPAVAGDRLLLCTDGLTGVVQDDVVREILVREDPPDVQARRLAGKAHDRGAPDNVTVVIVSLDADSSPDAP